MKTQSKLTRSTDRQDNRCLVDLGASFHRQGHQLLPAQSLESTPREYLFLLASILNYYVSQVVFKVSVSVPRKQFFEYHMS